MSRYSETIKPDTPKLVVSFKRNDRGDLDLAYSMTPGFSFIDLIGYVGRVQEALRGTKCFEWQDPDGEDAVVIVFYPVAKRFGWFAPVHSPVEPLCGMLEIVKQTLVTATVVHNQKQQQSPILGPDMRPFRRQVR